MLTALKNLKAKGVLKELNVFGTLVGNINDSRVGNNGSSVCDGTVVFIGDRRN